MYTEKKTPKQSVTFGRLVSFGLQAGTVIFAVFTAIAAANGHEVVTVVLAALTCILYGFDRKEASALNVGAIFAPETSAALALTADKVYEVIDATKPFPLCKLSRKFVVLRECGTSDKFFAIGVAYDWKVSSFAKLNADGELVVASIVEAQGADAKRS